MTHILIIDDSPTEVHVFKNMLQNNNIKVSVANNGDEGIEKAIKIKPDCILMDVVMPGMNGFQATRKLTQDSETAGIPVIMLSSKDSIFDRARGRIVGSEKYLTKPFSKEDLINAITAHVG